ncbi:PRC-barrel domain-containing protein [Methylobacterium nodulans]|uniref:PRC-barrel domain protein n=1 Tax=Methylobacterium nodulans (strain LMG 21967 / CNCM I-2342 / ORS 2060) TaxID=460265 RepID=B8ILX2_METNO|nr:PRC-barrel domain-containing protein [Methylobacterium nodulans]ACL56316.1 PRC-barrel domain protein [Methylobacterium nodulans ORS 2060]
MPTELPNERTIRAPGSMELDPTAEGVALDETRRLIASNKVEGTAVYNRKGESLGTIYNFMVDKVSGQVAYAVLSFGGFLGLGESYHPVPWRALTYDVDLGGYVIDIDADRLADAPRQGPDEDPFADPAFGGRVDAHWGARRSEAA